MVNRRSGRLLFLGLIAAPVLAVAAGPPVAEAPHMDEDVWQAMVLLDQLEWQDAAEGGALAWDLQAWAGTDDDRVLLERRRSQRRTAAVGASGDQRELVREGAAAQ